MYILIVDDDLVSMSILENLLQDAGFDTLSAPDLASAELLVRLKSVSLILLDMHLPDGDGINFCERLLRDSSLEGLPILFVSADDDKFVKVRGFAAGAVDYITKPFVAAEVLARVRTHLRLRAAYEALAKIHSERLKLLSTSQRQLMPKPEDLPDARFGVCLRQMEQAGGDFYDVYVAGNRVTDYVVADASGHDLGISLWTAAFKTVLREYASALHTPQALCRMINNSLRRVLPNAAYFTALYARLYRGANRLVLVNAGHPSAVLVNAGKKEATFCQQEGDILGVFSDAVFGYHEYAVNPGDRVFMFTDGLVEKSGSRQAGLQILQETCLRTVDERLDEAVQKIVKKVRGEEPMEDDIILLGFEV